MGRKKRPANVKKGKSESKEKLSIRAEQEQRLMGDTEKVKVVPEYLDALGQAYYKFLITELEISGLVGNLDIPLLEQTADTLSKIRQMDEILNQNGIIIQQIDRYGNEMTKENPAFGAKQKMLTQFRALSSLLGMSPSSRAQLAGMQIQAKNDEEDPLLQLLKG